MDTMDTTGIPGTGDLLHPKVRKAAEDWLEDAFGEDLDMRVIRETPDRHLKIYINRAWDGGWVDFIRTNMIDGQFV